MKLGKELSTRLVSQFNSFKHLSKPEKGATFVVLLVDILQGEMDIPILFPVHIYGSQLHSATQLEYLSAK